MFYWLAIRRVCKYSGEEEINKWNTVGFQLSHLITVIIVQDVYIYYIRVHPVMGHNVNSFCVP